MPRHRSISYYAKTEKEFLDKCEESFNKKNNTLFQRRKRRYNTTNSNTNYNYQNPEIYNKKFTSYDDLEFDELGINSTYQIENIENENEDHDTEIELLTKINNINLSFKEKNKENLINNILACSKNIINSFYSSDESNKINNFFFQQKKHKSIKIFPIKKFHLDSTDNNNKNNLLEKKVNSDKTLEYNFEDNNDSLNSLSNINIIQNENENIIFQNEEYDNININQNSQNSPLASTISSSISDISMKKDSKDIKDISDISNSNQSEKKSERSQTFDNSKWYNTPNEKGEKINSNQNKEIQDYIKNNFFLSKNIDYVDEHLKFLISGSDKRTKQILINEILNEKNKEKEVIYDFNIFKKIIKLLGDYIKLELLVEDCNLYNSLMLNVYLSIVNGLILTIDINEPKSSKYAYELLEKVKYNLNLNQKHFSVICICFNITSIKKGEKDIKEAKTMINKIENEFNIKTYYINYTRSDTNKNEKLENIINKYLSLAYLKKERNIKIKNFCKYRKKSSIN